MLRGTTLLVLSWLKVEGVQVEGSLIDDGTRNQFILTCNVKKTALVRVNGRTPPPATHFSPLESAL